MIGRDKAGGKYSSRMSRTAEQYPGAVNYQANDENQNPRTFEYDRVSDTNPGVTLAFGWEYLRVPFLWLNDDSWNDFNFEALSLEKGASSPDLISILPSGGIMGLAFDGAGGPAEELHGGQELLHDYKEGSDLRVHIHWMPVNGNAGTVRWYFEYAVKNFGEVYGAPTTIYGEEDAPGTAWHHMLTSIGTIDGTGLEIGSHLMFRIYRDSSADTYGSDTVLMSVGVHYLQNSLGSRQYNAK